MCTNKSFLNGKSKELAYLLRHDTTYNFPNDGYRDVKDLFENHDFTYPILEEIVRTDKKATFQPMICSPLGRQIKKYNLFIEWGVFLCLKNHFH